MCRAWGKAEFYPGETCEAETAAGYCESRTSRLFSAFQFFDHSSSQSAHRIVTVPRFGTELPRHSALSRASSRQTGGNELWTRCDFVHEPGSADLLVPRAVPRSSELRPRMYKPVAVRSDNRSTLHGHAAVYRLRAYLARCRSVGVNTCPARGGRA